MLIWHITHKLNCSGWRAFLIVVLLFWKRSADVVSAAVTVKAPGAAQKLEWKFSWVLPSEEVSFKKSGGVMSGTTVPADISGHMLDLDEDEDLEVFTKVNQIWPRTSSFALTFWCCGPSGLRVAFSLHQEELNRTDSSGWSYLYEATLWGRLSQLPVVSDTPFVPNPKPSLFQYCYYSETILCSCFYLSWLVKLNLLTFIFAKLKT